MPIFRGIEVELVSQFGAHQEYDNAEALATDHVHETSATREAYIAIHPGSQFWIRCSCGPVDECPFFYFKLLAEGVPVVGWECGAEEGWQGTIAFVPVDVGLSDRNRHTVEKRGFFFPSVASEGRSPQSDLLESRVCRARARKREHRQYTSGATLCNESLSLRLNVAGSANEDGPRRYFTYALADPIDEPFATVKYHCRSSDELSQLGIVEYQGHLTAPDITPMDEPVQFEAPVREGQEYPGIETAYPCDTLNVPTTATANSLHDGTAALMSSMLDGEEPSSDWAKRTPSPIRADRHRLQRRTTPPIRRTDEARVALLARVVTQAIRRKNPSKEPFA